MNRQNLNKKKKVEQLSYRKYSNQDVNFQPPSENMKQQQEEYQGEKSTMHSNQILNPASHSGHQKANSMQIHGRILDSEKMKIRQKPIIETHKTSIEVANTGRQSNQNNYIVQKKKTNIVTNNQHVKKNVDRDKTPNEMEANHKKSNSLMNQKMMQMLLSKEYGEVSQGTINMGQQAILKSQQVETKQVHHIKSKTFMDNDFVSVTEDHTSKTAQMIAVGKHSTPLTQKQKGAILIKEQQVIMNNILKQQPSQLKSKPSEIPLNQKAAIKKVTKFKVTSGLTTSFDKSVKNTNLKKQTNTLASLQAQQLNKKYIITSNNGIPNTTGIPTTGIITHAAVTGNQSIINSSTSNLHAVNHNRTKSDANYIMNIHSKGKTNYVVSNNQHVYQSKKTSNLRTMANNNQASNQGATKGLLNKVQVQHDYSKPGHKKNQHSTQVKSNYKNLVQGSHSINDSNTGKIDLEVFQSNQNKTTEQKYAELKMKYNDLLNKHINLAAQQTTDDRPKQSKTIVNDYDELIRNEQNGAPLTQQQSIDMQNAPEPLFNQLKSKQNQSYQMNNARQPSIEQPSTIFNIGTGQLEVDINEEGHQSSIYASSNQTPKSFKYQKDQIVGQIQKTQILGTGNYALQYSDGLSRMLGQGPIAAGSNQIINQNLSDGVKMNNGVRIVKIPKQSSSKYGNIQHKRSVSDGIFNNMIPKNKISQIPIKTNKKLLTFEKKIINIRQKQNIPLKNIIEVQDRIIEETKLENLTDENHQMTTENLKTLSQEENLLTDVGMERPSANQSHHEEGFKPSMRQAQLTDVPKHSLKYSMIVQEKDAYQDRYFGKKVHTIQTDTSEKKLGREQKLKGLQSDKAKKITNNQVEIGSIDVNQISKKYKQMRRSNIEYQGSSDMAQIQVKNNIHLDKNKLHRRVKSGVSDQIANKNIHQVANMSGLQFSQFIEKPNNSNLPSSGQRSLKSFKKKQIPAPVKKQNFMLIYEENNGESKVNNSRELSNEMIFQSNQQDQDHEQKIVNVSYNDFGQSQEANLLLDSTQEKDGKIIPVQQIGQIKSSNKNLNNFLEALQKIKPQNPTINSVSNPRQQEKSPRISSQKIKRSNLSEVPIGIIEQQARHDKYQKMKMKSQEPNRKQQKQGHQRIKSSNDGITIKAMFGENSYGRQNVNHSTDRHNEYDQNSHKNLQIKFIGDKTLISQQKPINKKGNIMKQDQINRLKYQNQINPIVQESNTNTGGHPSPIVSSQRLPQKVLAQRGDITGSPQVQNIFGAKVNNYCNESPLNDNTLQDFDESQNFSPMEKNNHNLIQNLNKGQKYNNNQQLQDGTKQIQMKGQGQISPQAPQVSERLITESDCPNGESPRSKGIRKLMKMINLSYRQQQLPPNTTINFYRIGKILGKGAFGKVNLAVHKLTECLCAVKSINKQYFSDESQSKKVMQEVVMLKRTRHKNIVRLYEYFETEKHILFVIELCAGGDLLNYVRRRRRLKEDIAKCLFKQIIESLSYCHRKNIVHRDIKLDNILLDSTGKVKICDFGVGKIIKTGEKMTEQCGTPAYIAPEILRDQGYYGFAVDIWSAGVVLYAMLYGTVPFKAANMSELQKIIMKAKYTLKEDISIEARELLKGLMEKDPSKRMTVGQVLQHPWLADAEDSSNVELFTDQEKQYIKTEFTYVKSQRYNRNFESSTSGVQVCNELMPQQSHSHSQLDKDMFTEHMLDSTQNSILKNCETKSVILAPFNSTKSNLNQDQNGESIQEFKLSDSVKELIEDRKIIKFGARVRDIDRQYEINNNADLDNGVYHKFDEDEENKEEVNNNEDEEESPEPIIEGDCTPMDEEEKEILKELKKQGKKKQKSDPKQTELQKLENMIHDQEEKICDEIVLPNLNNEDGNVNTENSQIGQFGINQQSLESINKYVSPSTVNHNNIEIIDEGDCTSPFSYKNNSTQNVLKQLYIQQEQEENIMIEEQLLQLVEQFGYPRKYLLSCLNQHELNYATTTYLLLHFQKKLIQDNQLGNELMQQCISNIHTEISDRSSYRLKIEAKSSNILNVKSIPDMN